MTRWGIIGAGGIARVFANGIRFSRSGRLAAVASMTEERRRSLARDFDVPRSYAAYDELLADPEVDAVYVSLIHPHHARWAIAAARARKHVLVEKPMAMNAAEAASMVEAARANDVFLMEAFMYRCHPQTARMVELIREGAIGEVVAVRATFSFSMPFDAGSRLFNRELGGGAILDVGGYVASMARLAAGAAAGRPFAEPVRLSGAGVTGASGVDTFAAATAEFPNGVIAQLTCGMTCRMPRETEVYGTRGKLVVPDCWLPSDVERGADKPLPMGTAWTLGRILLWEDGSDAPREITVPADRFLYSYEADVVDEHIKDRQAPQMSWEDSLGNMRVLDRWLGEIGADGRHGPPGARRCSRASRPTPPRRRPRCA
jgi:predicted dehydrogenase